MPAAGLEVNPVGRIERDHDSVLRRLDLNVAGQFARLLDPGDLKVRHAVAKKLLACRVEDQGISVFGRADEVSVAAATSGENISKRI